MRIQQDGDTKGFVWSVDFVGAECVVSAGQAVVTVTAASSIEWGHLTGSIAAQEDLQGALNDKQDALTFSTGLDNTGNVVTVVEAEIDHTGLDNVGTNTHAQIDSHIASTSNPHSVTAAQAGAVPTTYLDTDVTLAADSNSKVATQKATKSYVDTGLASVTGGLTYKGLLDASQGSYPSNPSSGYYYIISVAGTISGTTYAIADWAVYNGSSWDKIDNQQVSYTASSGVQLVTRDFQIDLADTSPSLEVSDGGLRVKVDSSSIERASSGLQIKASGVTNAMLAGSIADSKLNQITTASKTHGSSLTGLASVPSDAGVLPIANIATGTPDGTKFVRDDGVLAVPAGSAGVAASVQTAHYFNSSITQWAWTNMPAAATALASWLKVDLTDATQFRLGVYQAVAGYAGADLNVQYSTDGVNFSLLDGGTNTGEVDVGAGTGLKIGAWVNIAAGAKGDVILRLIGKQGDGVADPAWRDMWVDVKRNSSVVDFENPSQSVYYREISFASAPATAQTWTNMPTAVTELFGGNFARFKVDLTTATHYRIVCTQTVAGYAGADLNLQYSNDGTNWYACDTAAAGELDVGTGTGSKTGAWAPIVPGANADVFVRLVGKAGDGVVDPAWRQIAVQFKQAFSFEGVPVGGTTGQVLAKSSNSNYATEWVTASSGGAGKYTVVAKTDDYTLTSSDTEKLITMDAATTKTLTVSAGLAVGSWFIFTKLQASQLNILMSGSEKLMTGGAGCAFKNVDEALASAMIIKISSTQWTFLTQGFWTTTE